MTEACPRCGREEEDTEPGLRTCERHCRGCGLWWRPGDAGRGWEWWSELGRRWTKALEGVLTVLGGRE